MPHEGFVETHPPRTCMFKQASLWPLCLSSLPASCTFPFGNSPALQGHAKGEGQDAHPFQCLASLSVHRGTQQPWELQGFSALWSPGPALGLERLSCVLGSFAVQSDGKQFIHYIKYPLFCLLIGQSIFRKWKCLVYSTPCVPLRWLISWLKWTQGPFHALQQASSKWTGTAERPVVFCVLLRSPFPTVSSPRHIHSLYDYHRTYANLQVSFLLIPMLWGLTVRREIFKFFGTVKFLEGLKQFKNCRF